MIEVDARGLSCPIPVVRVKEAIQEHPGVKIKVLLEEVEQQENVIRMAKNLSYEVEHLNGLDIMLIPAA